MNFKVSPQNFSEVISPIKVFYCQSLLSFDITLGELQIAAGFLPLNIVLPLC